MMEICNERLIQLPEGSQLDSDDDEGINSQVLMNERMKRQDEMMKRQDEMLKKQDKIIRQLLQQLNQPSDHPGLFSQRQNRPPPPPPPPSAPMF
ncbi:hypothetical protein TIFTF001_027950 [Ficus carica]|uniref:Uncharacterized protein n=1 Tax=Ficus carica TaxID=3494 RepID=A0AA88DNV9_FICCA|nr:hypothetical protein TIFTF001_027950 [Ficus carica]